MNIMDRDSVDWRGYIPALTTPVHADGELDRAGWQELVEWMVAEGMHGIVVAGSSGEWFSLEPDERIELFELAIRQVRGRIPVLACCNAISPRESMRHARAAVELGADGIVLAPPPYSRPNDEEVLAFYDSVVSEIPLPLCLYNWPRGTGIDLSPELIARLADLPTVVAIKNSTGSLAAFVQTFFALRDRLRIFGFGADELSMSLIRDHGGDGTIGGGAVLGRDHPAYFEALWRGDMDAAREAGARDKRFFDFSMYPDFSPRFASAQAVMKAALNARGLPGGFPRPPLLPLTEAETESVRAVMAELGLARQSTGAGVPSG
jgi:4-hydroxy-tetrahydrodipicolinate synthase